MSFPNLDFPVIDGIAPSYADIAYQISPTGLNPAGLSALAAAGPLLTVKDIKSINTSTTLEIGSVRGANGGRRMRRTTGQRDEAASFEMYKDAYHRLLRSFLTLAPRRGNQALISLVHFSFAVMYSVPGSVETFEVRLKGCRIAGREANDTEGSDPTVVNVTLNPLEVCDVVDGVEVVLI